MAFVRQASPAPNTHLVILHYPNVPRACVFQRSDQDNLQCRRPHGGFRKARKARLRHLAQRNFIDLLLDAFCVYTVWPPALRFRPDGPLSNRAVFAETWPL
jgi:hypothetical protein